MLRFGHAAPTVVQGRTLNRRLPLLCREGRGEVERGPKEAMFSEMLGRWMLLRPPGSTPPSLPLQRGGNTSPCSLPDTPAKKSPLPAELDKRRQQGIYVMYRPYDGGGKPMKTAKLFKNGQSQAVRLPKEFRFPGREVQIKKIGQAVVLLPPGWGGATSRKAWRSSPRTS